MRIFFAINRGHRTGKLLVASLAVVSICLLCLTSLSCLDWQKPKYTHNNDYSPVLGHANFNVVAKEIGASAQGSILISQSKPKWLDITVTASFIISPNDWHGVRFILPHDCYIEDILCTYIDDNSSDSSFIPLVYGGHSPRFGLIVQVGDPYPSGITSGGPGVIVITAALPIEGENEVADLRFGVDIGAKMSDGGYWILGVAHETMIIQLEYK